jgi:hypothetical protein
VSRSAPVDLELSGVGCAVLALVSPRDRLNEKLGIRLDVPFEVRE